jgi:hypothetical protein
VSGGNGQRPPQLTVDDLRRDGEPPPLRLLRNLVRGLADVLAMHQLQRQRGGVHPDDLLTKLLDAVAEWWMPALCAVAAEPPEVPDDLDGG